MADTQSVTEPPHHTEPQAQAVTKQEVEVAKIKQPKQEIKSLFRIFAEDAQVLACIAQDYPGLSELFTKRALVQCWNSLDFLQRVPFYKRFTLQSNPEFQQDSKFIFPHTCAICNSGEPEPGNPLVYCENPNKQCEVIVHQHCYGIKQVPSGAWLCDRCEDCPDEVHGTVCPLCPFVGVGAFKRLAQGRRTGGFPSARFIHFVCAHWGPEVCWTHEPNVFHQVNDISQIHHDRFEIRCLLCKQRGASWGSIIQCHHEGCARSYHAMCARQHGLSMEVIPAEMVDSTPADVILEGPGCAAVWCPQHSILRNLSLR